MRTLRQAIPIATLMTLLAATTWAGTLTGTVKVGNVFVDETGDRSTVQETYDLEEGFALSRIALEGTLSPRSRFLLDLRDLNLRSRAANVALRVPGHAALTGSYDQNRYVFDPGRGITSERKDCRAGLRLTPMRWMTLSADVNHQAREGERLALPSGTASALGDRYDDRFVSGQVTADFHEGRRGGGVSLQLSDYADELNPVADRRGRVMAARFYAPMPFTSRWTNLLRASYGVRQLTEGGIEHRLSSFQYTGVMQPRDAWELKYGFLASRVDDNALDLLTDRFVNDVDAAWSHRLGRVSAGFGYEMNDDDRTLTTYQTWRAGASYRPNPRFRAKVDWANRVKDDQEDLTLLRDIESSRFRAQLDLEPAEHLSVGGDIAQRKREHTDIGVTMDGLVVGARARYELKGWGALAADFTHTLDEYVDRAGTFDARSDIVTARVEIARIPRLRLAGGVTYLDIGEDLDIEKSTVFGEGEWKMPGGFSLGAKYQCFNYDDYILIDRYYTANIVRIDLGYDLKP